MSSITVSNTEVTVSVTDSGVNLTVAQGQPGVGVPAGGTVGQVLVKTSSTDYATGWQTFVATASASVQITVRNSTGSTIAAGTVVRISGALGQNPQVQAAIATSYANSDAIGVVASAIANNATGQVTTTGLVENLDTSAFSDGDRVYLSATVAGSLTTTEPTRPNWGVHVGFIAHAHPTQGKLLVAPNVETRLVSDLNDVTATGVALMQASDAAAARSALSLGTAATKDIPAAGNATSSQVVYGTDTRLTDSRTPSGTAGGSLAGTYPNPSLASGSVSYSTIQNVTPQRLLGNPGVGAAAPSEISLTFPLQFSGSALQVNWPGSATGQVFYRSGTTITASTKLVFDASTTTFTLNDGLGDIISLSPFGLFAPLMTLGDVSHNGTNFQIDDSAQTITATASTFNIDGNTIGAYTANAYFSTVTAGTFSGGFGEYFTNPSNGVVEIGPDGTSSAQQALTLTYNSVADWIRFGTKRKSDGNTTSGIFYFDRPLYMATGTEQQWGGWYTASAQSSAKACFTIGLLSGAQVSGSSGSMVLVTNNQKGSSNRVPTTAHTDPTLYLYAYDQSLGTISNDYLRMWHQVTSANIESGRGDLNLITPSGSNVKANGSTLATQAFAIIQAVALA